MSTQIIADSESPNHTVYLCYRQADGIDYARWIYEELGNALSARGIVADIYFDQSAPAVQDWTTIQQPALERASAMIVIVTPGLYSDFGNGDWVAKELNWWVKTRSVAPILITPFGERWIPKQIGRRWPNAQRVNVDQHLWRKEDASSRSLATKHALEQIIEGLSTSKFQVAQEELIRSKSLNRRLTLLLRACVALVALLLVALYTINMQNRASTAESLVAQSGVLQSTRGDESLALAAQAYAEAPTPRIKDFATSLLESRPQVAYYLDGTAQFLRFNASGTTLFGIRSDQDGSRILEWDGLTGRRVNAHFQVATATGADPENQPAYLTGLAISPNGRYLASHETSVRIIVWDTVSGRIIDSFPCGTSSFAHGNQLEFLDDDHLLYFGDNVLRLWSITKRAEQMQVALGDESSAADIVSERGPDIIRVTSSGAVNVYNARDGRLLERDVFNVPVDGGDFALASGKPILAYANVMAGGFISVGYRDLSNRRGNDTGVYYLTGARPEVYTSSDGSMVAQLAGPLLRIFSTRSEDWENTPPLEIRLEDQFRNPVYGASALQGSPPEYGVAFTPNNDLIIVSTSTDTTAYFTKQHHATKPSESDLVATLCRKSNMSTYNKKRLLGSKSVC